MNNPKFPEKLKNTMASKLSMQEKVIQTIRTGLQIVPFGIGSAIDQAYFGSIDTIKVKRIEAFMEELTNALSSKDLALIDTAEFKNDEFVYFMENILRRVLNEVQREKLTALKGALVSIITETKKFGFDIQNNFLKSLDLIDAIHIHLLSLLASRYAEDDANRYLSVAFLTNHLNAVSEAQKNFIYSSLDVLANREFILSGPVPFDSQGKIDKPKQKFRLTELGHTFLDFIKKDC